MSVCRGGAAIAEWQKNNPDPKGGTLLGLEWSTSDSGVSAEERDRADIEAMLARHGQSIPI